MDKSEVLEAKPSTVFIVTHGEEDYDGCCDVWAVLHTIEDAKKYVNREVSLLKFQWEERRMKPWTINNDSFSAYEWNAGNEFIRVTAYTIAVLDDQGHPTRETCELSGCSQCARRDCPNSNENLHWVKGCPECTRY